MLSVGGGGWVVVKCFWGFGPVPPGRPCRVRLSSDHPRPHGEVEAQCEDMGFYSRSDNQVVLERVISVFCYTTLVGIGFGAQVQGYPRTSERQTMYDVYRRATGSPSVLDTDPAETRGQGMW